MAFSISDELFDFTFSRWRVRSMNASEVRYIVWPHGKFLSHYKTSCSRSNYSSVLILFSVLIIPFYKRKSLGDYT